MVDHVRVHEESNVTNGSVKGISKYRRAIWLNSRRKKIITDFFLLDGEWDGSIKWNIW